jgi:hypothetical protein
VSGELITIASYSTSYEANVVRSGLEAFGVEAILADEHTINANWVWSNALGGVKIRVSESEVELARDLIKVEPRGAEEEQEAWGASTTICPMCSSPHTRFFLDKRGAFLAWLVLGIPLLPPMSKRTCSNCGHKWKI